MSAYQHTAGELLPLDRICARTPPGGSKAQRFADKMQAGEVFPPVGVRAWADGKFFVIDGGHRLAASLLAGFTDIPVLVEGLR